MVYRFPIFYRCRFRMKYPIGRKPGLLVFVHDCVVIILIGKLTKRVYNDILFRFIPTEV